jgi:hypothetical protein
VASVVQLAVSNEAERCTVCQAFHIASTGGPAAAVEKAIRYLDAYHEGDRLHKVQSRLRGGSDSPWAVVRRAADAPPHGGEAARSMTSFTEFMFPGRRN